MMPPKISSGNIKYHWSWITITNRIKMKKIEILQAVPKCDRETLSEQILLENGTNRCAQYRVNIGFV